LERTNSIPTYLKLKKCTEVLIINIAVGLVVLLKLLT